MSHRFLPSAACLLLSAGLLLPLSGCIVAAVAAAGVGTYAYVKGEMKTTLSAPLDRAYDAAKAALVDDLQFALTDDRKDALQAIIKAREADKTQISLNLNASPDGKLTDITVRVGTFGDEAKSRLILDKIRARL